MGKPLTLVAVDSHKLGAYRTDPAGTPKGGVVVIQEIFGVNHHIRSVCDRLAPEGMRRRPLADRFIMAGRSRPMDGVVSLAYVPAIHDFPG